MCTQWTCIPLRRLGGAPSVAFLISHSMPFMYCSTSNTTLATISPVARSTSANSESRFLTGQLLTGSYHPLQFLTQRVVDRLAYALQASCRCISATMVVAGGSHTRQCVFGRGCHSRPSSAACPPNNHGPASAGQCVGGGAVTTGQAAQLAPKKRTCISQAPTKRGVCASISPITPTRDPRRRRTQHPSHRRRSPRRYQPHWRVTCNQLASADVFAARRDSASSHPGRAHFSLPRRTCVCARHTAAP
jgi:hypothetical protein